MTVVTDNASNMTKAFDFSLPGYTTDKDDESDSDDEDLADPSEDATSSEGPLTEYLPTHSLTIFYIFTINACLDQYNIAYLYIHVLI